LTSGGLDQVKEAVRDVRQPRALADIGADVRFAWRMLVKDRWFTAGAILTLALAMGVANTTFITTYATLWRDLPVDRPTRIAIVRTLDGRGREGGVSYPDFDDWRQNARVFAGRAAALTSATISLGRDGGVPEQFDGLYVSADTFSVLRVTPVLGRDFSPADDRPGADAVVIIGSNVWKGRYGARRDVLGRTVSVNGTTPATIIGVMPDGFRFPDSTDVWMPLAQLPAATRQHRDARTLYMIGRLPDGASLDGVRAELSRIATNLAATYPDTNKDVRPWVNSLWEAFNGGLTISENPLPLLAAVLVLVIASANLANLLLVRGVSRSREIAIRFALGATRTRIVRQLLMESVLLALVAWGLALGGSWLALKVPASQVDVLPYWRLKMDLRLLAMLAGVAVGTTALFGLAPALYVSRRGNPDGLKESGRMTAGPKSRRWTLALLVVQFALTLALLNGAGLTAKTFYSLYAIDRKVQSFDAMTTFIRLPPQEYATPAQRVAFHDQLRDRLRAVPGITASTIASAPPFSGVGRRRLTAVDGRPVSDPPPNVLTVVVEPDYFRTVVSGLILGEPFSNVQGTPGREAAIVNQRFADVYLGAGSPLGRHLELRAPPQPRTPTESARAIDMAVDSTTPPIPMTIIGVAPDIRQGDVNAPIVYLPFRAEAPAGVTLIVRGSVGSAHIASSIRNAINVIDPQLALGAIRTVNEVRDRSRLLFAAMASQFAKISALALLFSGVGLYSAMAYALKRRTQEIAIRMTLGAPPHHVRWLFLKTGAWVATGGLVLGVPASMAVSRLLQNSVLRIGPTDVGILAGLVVVLVTVALGACIVPARRATRLEPTIALRVE
jgi:putative ABC transport system permease protein